MKSKFLIFLSLTLLSFAVTAKDLGIQGKIFEITDVDIRLIVMKQLSGIDWDKKGDEYRDSVVDQLEGMPYTVKLPPVEEINVKPIDMRTMITKDITAPIQNADGSVEQVVLAKAGDVVDPFQYVAPITKYLFFDPTDKAQMGLAVQLKESGMAEKYTLEFAVTGGDVLGTADQLRGVFYAYDYIVKKFKLERNLSLVFFHPGTKTAYVAELTRSTTIGEIDELLKQYFKK